MTSQHVKNKKVRHETKSSGVTVVLYTLWRLLWFITAHTHTENVIYLLYTIKTQMVYWSILGAWKKKHKSADAICVCPFNRSRSTTNKNAHRSHVIVKIEIFRENFDWQVPLSNLRRLRQGLHEKFNILQSNLLFKWRWKL